MKMSEEMAVRLHRMMWSDMQRELGDCPDGNDRIDFKHEWVKRNFPGESIANDCWLCEYASSVANRKGGDPYCMHCPIKWPNRHCNTIGFSYAKNPISEFLAVPAKNGEKSINDRDLMTLAYCNTKTELAKASGLPEENATIDHIKAIQAKASNEKELSEARKELKGAIDVLNSYRSTLSYESNLPSNAPVAAHIKQIREYAFRDGKIHERERIMDKIGEMLNDKPAGTCKDI